MFDVGFSEVVIIAIIALVIFGSRTAAQSRTHARFLGRESPQNGS